MNRKMKKEKTTKEKVNTAMKKATWEEAREVGVEILGKYVAFNAHMDGKFDFHSLMREIAERGDKWVTQEGGAAHIAGAKMYRRMVEKEKEKETK